MSARGPRVVFLGAGSVQFAPSLVVDLLRRPDLAGATLAMVDTDEPALELTHSLARRLVDAAGADVYLEATTDRTAALPGADAVIISVEIDRFATWESDRRVPALHGVAQALGENGGPGGLAHALRQIPPIIEICNDVHRFCPDALVLNLSNPLSRIGQAIADHTEVRCIGLCHEIMGGNRVLEGLLAREISELEVTAAGINHFTWYLSIRDRETGRDLYPEVLRRGPRVATDSRLLVAELLRLTGWLCVTNDSHAGEYLAGGHLWRSEWAPDVEPLDFYGWYRGYMADRESRMRRLAAGSGDLSELLGADSGEDVIDIIADVLHGRAADLDAVNVANDGHVANLPRGCIVEVPGRIDGGLVVGRPVGELPQPIAEWCRRQVAVQRLASQAAMEGSRQLVVEALLLDPVVPGAHVAGRLADALLEANRPYLPRFH